MGDGRDPVGAGKPELTEEPAFELVPAERKGPLDEGSLDERSRALFAKLADGDPCGLFELCARRLREQNYLVDAERLFGLSLALVARAAAAQGESVLRKALGWMTREVDTALEMILREDQEEARALSACSPNDTRYRSIALSFGIEPSFVPVAVSSFNSLPQSVRRVFFALIVEGSSISDCTKAELGSVDSLQKDVRRAFRAMGHLDALARDTKEAEGRSKP